MEFRWVKGHANVTENERCDQLAMQAAQQGELTIDEVYERENPASRPLVESNCRPPAGTAAKVTREGQPCRKCGQPVEKRLPRKRRMPGQTYYYEFYLACPRCRTMYLVEEAKRQVQMKEPAVDP